MMRRRELNVTIVDTPFNPDSSAKVIEFDDSKNQPLYKVWLYLEGPDLPYVQSVTYYLHSSFRNPRKTVRRTPSNSDCRLLLRTWGIFTVEVEIEDRSGEIYTLSHDLTYDQHFQTKGVKFVPMENAQSPGKAKPIGKRN